MSASLWESQSYLATYEWLVQNLNPIQARGKAKARKMITDQERRTLAAMDGQIPKHNEELLQFLERREDAYFCLIAIVLAQGFDEKAAHLREAVPPDPSPTHQHPASSGTSVASIHHSASPDHSEPQLVQEPRKELRQAPPQEPRPVQPQAEAHLGLDDPQPEAKRWPPPVSSLDDRKSAPSTLVSGGSTRGQRVTASGGTGNGGGVVAGCRRGDSTPNRKSPSRTTTASASRETALDCDFASTGHHRSRSSASPSTRTTASKRTPRGKQQQRSRSASAEVPSARQRNRRPNSVTTTAIALPALKAATRPPPHLWKNGKGETKLHVAAAKGKVDDIRRWLEAGSEVNAKDHAGWTALHDAVERGHVALADVLLQSGALVNCPGNDSDTPLHIAAGNNHLAMATLLVQHGASLSLRNRPGQTALEVAHSVEMQAVLIPNTHMQKSPCARDGSTNVCILASGLSHTEKEEVTRLAYRYRAAVVQEFTKSVTHVIVPVDENRCCPRTIKVLKAILSGVWLLAVSWVHESLLAGSWADEEGHEVEGAGDKRFHAPRKGRLNTLNKLPGLFDGCSFYLHGEFSTLSRDELCEVIATGKGKLLSREPRVDWRFLTQSPPTECAPKKPSPMTSTEPPVAIGNQDKNGAGAGTLVASESSGNGSGGRTPRPFRLTAARAYTVPYHARVGSPLAFCSQFILYDHAANRQPARLATPHLCTVSLAWLLDSISHFDLRDIETQSSNSTSAD